MTVFSPPTTSTLSHRVWWTNFLAILLFWGTYVAIQTSLPAVNEPHYLCKAKHFWQPDYCPGDFFLNSSNTHFTFYVAFGWIATIFSLETTALIGRSVGLLLLAAGWTSLVLRVSNVAWAPIGAAALFLGVTSWQNLSGEWIVGGIESKVIAYGFLFLSWTMLCGRSWNTAAVLQGLAISFHPVVGIWSLAATLFALGGVHWWNGQSLKLLEIRRHIFAVVLVVFAALPGLIPALSALQSTVPNMAETDRLQVFVRLGHHLNPLQFPVRAFQLYGVLLLAWAVMSVIPRRSASGAQDTGSSYPAQLWTGIVAGSVLIAVAGLAIGWLQWMTDSDLLVKLMKFYPFRLADVLLPMAVAISIINLVKLHCWTARWLAGPVLIGCVCAAYVALTLDMPSRNPERHSAAKMASWIDICGWMKTNTPADAVVMVPTSSITFRWYASRAAYVTVKDCPQDAAGLLEWDRRIKLYKSWASRSYKPDQHYSEQDLAELARLTGASYLIASRMGPMEIEPIHRNQHYRVYRLPQTGVED